MRKYQIKNKIGAVLLFFLSLPVIAGEYTKPKQGNDLVGENYTITTEQGDSLDIIRGKHGVSYDELLVANPGINFYKLKVGQRVVIPKQFILPKFREGIVVNTPELRLYYFDVDSDSIFSYPVGLGRENWRTPLTATKVVGKKANPPWRVPESIRNYVYNKTGKLLPDVVAPGPQNPLGSYALYLSKSGYLIHGTNAPTSVGTFISSGCIRMLKDPIETLYREVEVGTPVRIIHYPYKAGWLGNKLYLEVHKAVATYAKAPSSELNCLDVKAVIQEATSERPAKKIDWEIVEKIIKEKSGIPGVIGYD